MTIYDKCGKCNKCSNEIIMRRLKYKYACGSEALRLAKRHNHSDVVKYIERLPK